LHAAHQECAKRSFTSHFFVVDADNIITDPNVFAYKIPWYDTQYVHLWYALNPVNDLEYGWGGLKLFPKLKDYLVFQLPICITSLIRAILQVFVSLYRDI